MIASIEAVMFNFKHPAKYGCQMLIYIPKPAWKGTCSGTFAHCASLAYIPNSEAVALAFLQISQVNMIKGIHPSIAKIPYIKVENQ